MKKTVKDEVSRLVVVLSFLLAASLGLRAVSNAQEQRINPQQGRASNPLEGNPDAIKAGQMLFDTACSGCHGEHAEGGRGPNLADGRLVRRRGVQRLFGSIHNGVPGTEMPGFNLPDQQIWQMLAFISSLSAPAAASKVPGNPEVGKEIYSGKGKCSSCHMILGQGGFLGPDLSNVGALRSWNQLKQALLDPNSRQTSGYEGVTVVTTTGAEITGIAKYQTNYSLAVLDAAGKLHLLPMQDVQKLTIRDDSLMSDYQGRLTPQEIEDVLAFLSRQSVRPITPGTVLGRRAREIE
jgi:putative heme-binding domain-containing protein